MSSPVCAHKYELARLASLNFQISQLVYLISIFSTFISSYYAYKIVHRKSIFQNSTKLLLFQNLFSANLHQIFYGLAAIDRLYKAYLQDSCIPLRAEVDCVWFLECLVAGISGMIYGQTGLLVERACATFMMDYEKKKSMTTGLLIAFLVLVLSFGTVRIIVWDDKLDGYALSCNAFPKGSAERSSTFFSVCTCISLFNLLMSVLLRKYNKKFEYR
ncbi:hypothetical protein CRE_03082 [Caenorhabditis remanei]|uniref:Uncharacterized protein n=1 Tax=Caenorhabditis remanei TaxID=31234 RepID=E3LWG2_CAERE|nr:hypothetical protein CRE_03082 [Caenorhabditis remanei]